MDDDLQVRKAHYEDGRVDIWARHPLIPELAQSLATFFDDNDAANYVEVKVSALDGRTFALSLQLVGNLTPNDKVKAAEAISRKMAQAIVDKHEMYERFADEYWCVYCDESGELKTGHITHKQDCIVHLAQKVLKESEAE